MIIKQIEQTDNWWAIFRSKNEPIIERVACWAILSDGRGNDYVVGMIDVCRGFFDAANTISNFEYYLYAKNEIEAYDKALYHKKEEE